MQTNDQVQIESFVIEKNTWNHFTVCKEKMSSGLFKDFMNKISLQIIYI